MANVDLDNIKQADQIRELRLNLEKVGWEIVEETERKFKGKPRWNHEDETPNLIYSWTIQRGKLSEVYFLDFIAWWDFFTYETLINDCDYCCIRGLEIKLSFVKDKNLKYTPNYKKWKIELSDFVNETLKLK